MVLSSNGFGPGWEKEPGEYKFAWLDEIVNSLLDRGVQPWFNIGYVNTHYSPNAPHWIAVGWVPTQAQDARAAWRKYVHAPVTHFSDRVSNFEMWNEVNVIRLLEAD